MQKNIFSNQYVGMYAQAGGCLATYDNDSGGTPPAYGMFALYDSIITYVSTVNYVTGSTATSYESYGGKVRYN